MKSIYVLCVLVSFAAVSAVCFGQLPPREVPIGQLNNRAAEAANRNVSPQAAESAVSNAANRAELAPAVASALARYRISSEAVETGQVVAVLNGRSQLVTQANLATQADAGAVFVQQVRPVAVAEVAPGALRASLQELPDVQGERALKLGFQVTVPMSDGSALKLDAWAKDGSGLSLHTPQAAYAGTFYVALSNALDPSDRMSLANPTPIAITAVGSQSVDPDPLRIGTLGTWEKVSIAVPAPESDRYPVSVSADPNRPGDTVELAVTRPIITLSARSSSIVGWGIGQTTIDVQSQGILSPENQRVLLGGTGGVTLDPVVLDSKGQGTTILRSTRSPQSRITVSQPQARGEPLTVSFDSPWLFLAFAAGGGLIGAFLRGRGRQKWPQALAIGVASAVIMVVAYALGVDWPSRIPGLAGLAKSGEVLVAFLGAVGALVGVSFIVKVPESGGSSD